MTYGPAPPAAGPFLPLAAAGLGRASHAQPANVLKPLFTQAREEDGMQEAAPGWLS